jgi:hypothetical protein
MSDTIETVIRAARADQLLSDDTLNAAFNSHSEAVLGRLLRASLSDPTECVAAVAALQASQEFKEQLRSFITSGKAAERKPFKVA